MKVFRLYGRVLGEIGRNRRLMGLLAVVNLVAAALQFLDPMLFGQVIALLGQTDAQPAPDLMGQGVRLVGIWAAIAGAGIALNLMTALGAERLAHRTRLDAISQAFNHVLTLPTAFHTGAHSGRVMKTLTVGTDTIFGLTLSFFRENLATAVAVFILLPLSALLNWRLSIVLFVLVAVFTAATAIVVRRTQTGQRLAETANTAMAARAQDALGNVVAVQSFGQLDAEARGFTALVDQVLRHQFPVLNWWAAVSVLTRAASTIAVISLVIIGTFLHLRHLASIADVVSFMGFATMLIGRLDGAVHFTGGLFMRAPVLADFFTLLDTRSTVPEREDAEPVVVTHGEVAFENVSFAYSNGPRILSGVSFLARPGTVTALVGATGAGKSTAMNLLQRLSDPSEGGILIDGQDLRDVTLGSLRDSVGVVFQESLLFNRSIRENLRVGKPDATNAELQEACRLAEAHDFIMRQPQGYDTLVGERGTTLSGGQRQRLAIARALLKDAPILILDEATSALDAATEARVTRAMQNLMRGRTTFVIAHRLSTIRDADDILVFDQGQIVERGGFAELVSAGGVFCGLAATQLTPALV